MFCSLLHLLDERARSLPTAPVFTFLAEDGATATLTYGELLQRSKRMAARLRQEFSPGDRAILVFPPGLDFIQAFFACVFAGVIPIPTSYPRPRRPMSRLESIFTNAEPAVVITSARVLEQSIEAQEKHGSVPWWSLESLDFGDPTAYEPLDITPNDVCFLQYTSGSTSDPKGVILSHANVLANLEAIQRGFRLDNAASGHVQRGVFWLPAYHDMGLIGGILTPLFVGGQALLMSPAHFLQSPIRWLRAIHESRAVISGAPNFAYELCVRKTTPEQREGLSLDSWRLAFCGAEPVRAETLSRFTAMFAPHGFRSESFYPCYGLAESTLLAAGSVHAGPYRKLTVDREALHQNRIEISASDENAQEIVSCGSPTIAGECRVVDPTSHETYEPGRVGEIWLRGPSVAAGYWRRERETREKFHALLPGDSQPWLRTGDLGAIWDGELYVTGRLSDRIILRGRNYYPQDLEALAASAHVALRREAAAAFSVVVEGEEQVVVAVEVNRSDREPSCEEIVAAIRGRLLTEAEIVPHTVVLLRYGSLPLTTSGKIQRHQARKRFLAADWRVLHQSTNQLPHTVRADEDALAAQLADEGRRYRGRELQPAELERFTRRIETWLLNWLKARGFPGATDGDPQRPFAELGLDSLAALELSQMIEQRLEVKLTAVAAWEYPTPAKLAQFLASSAARPAPQPTITDEANVDADFERLLAEVEHLSESEAQEALLNATNSRTSE